MSTSVGRPLLSVFDKSGDARSVDENFSNASERVDKVASTDECSDEGLIALISQGQNDALAALFHRYARIVRAVAYRVLRDTSEADDILQDLFILIQRKCGMFDPIRGPARCWILQMAYHCALTRRRYLNSRHFYTRVDLADVENELSNGGNGVGGQEYGDDALWEHSGLKDIFAGLSDDQRETLRLFFVEGYTLPEIAVKLNQSHGNVKHHYFRGLEKLRKHVFNGKLRGNSAV
jgi:RNA polymerase sigma-70 factor, ECF subfamily